MNESGLAQQLLNLIGGKQNINQVPQFSSQVQR